MRKKCSIQQGEKDNCWSEQSPKKIDCSVFWGHPVYVDVDGGGDDDDGGGGDCDEDDGDYDGGDDDDGDDDTNGDNDNGGDDYDNDGDGHNMKWNYGISLSILLRINFKLLFSLFHVQILKQKSGTGLVLFPMKE